MPLVTQAEKPEDTPLPEGLEARLGGSLDEATGTGTKALAASSW